MTRCSRWPDTRSPTAQTIGHADISRKLRDVAFDFHYPELPHRGLPVVIRDPLGNDTTTAHDTTIAYDRPYHLLPERVTDAVGLTSSAEYDYRVLQPRMVTDANGNRSAVTFSPLGFVTTTAVMGKEGEQAGDTPETPGARMEYDFFAFERRAANRTRSRSSSAASCASITPRRPTCCRRNGTRRSRSVEYSDGFGRLLQTRTQAEDVLFGDPHLRRRVSCPPTNQSPTGDAVGRRRAAGDPPNVIVSGWQVYDNKGRVVEKYEPFFAAGWDYAPPGDTQLGPEGHACSTTRAAR